MTVRWSTLRARAAGAFSGLRGSGWQRGATLLGLLALVALVVIVLASRAGPVAQPVAFNHVKHTRDLELGCNFCHQNVSTGARAGLPNAETCSACHQAQQGNSAEALRVTTLLEQGDPLRFNKLFRLADHVYFAHRRHVEIAKLECSQCHGAIATTRLPPDRALTRVDMKFCVSCHQAKKQSVDCVACHR